MTAFSDAMRDRNDSPKTLNAAMDNSHESLSRAKDRAQLTATGAMSIVNVALLKQILDQGPEGNPYYTVSLALIGSSLGLQALAGLLSIVMTSLTGYYAKHQDDVCEDLCENMCGCRCESPRRRTRKTYPRTGHALVSLQPTSGATEVHEVMELAEVGSNMADLPEVRTRHRSDTADRIGCCPCLVTSRILEEFEYEILDLHHDWEECAVSIELQAAESKIMLQYWMEQIPKLKEDIDKIKSNSPETSDADNAQLQNLEKELKDCEENVAKHERITRAWKISQAKGTYLNNRASAIRRNQILKRATFWQHFINFLFFLVFILNAFITGIGIVGNDDRNVPPEVPGQN